MGMLNIDEHVEEHRVLAIRYPDKAVMLGQIIRFPGFAPRLLASLVASSTAACTSGVVTVTATAHTIPATSFNGYSFYYPGSASLAAGWYSEFSRTGADTVTFSAPLSADFASESVNAGAAFTSEVTTESVVLPANSLSVGDRVTFTTFRNSSNAVGTKSTRIRLNSNIVFSHMNASTTLHIGASDISFTIDSSTTAIGGIHVNGTMSTAWLKVAANVSEALTVDITSQLSAAGMYLAILCQKLRIE